MFYAMSYIASIIAAYGHVVYMGGSGTLIIITIIIIAIITIILIIVVIIKIMQYNNDTIFAVMFI